jgi:hypothetical protein
VALNPQGNYTGWATATCRRNLVPSFVDRRVSRGQRGGSPTAVNLSFLDRSRYFSLQVAPHLLINHKNVEFLARPSVCRRVHSPSRRTTAQSLSVVQTHCRPGSVAMPARPVPSPFYATARHMVAPHSLIMVLMTRCSEGAERSGETSKGSIWTPPVLIASLPFLTVSSVKICCLS